MLMILVTVVLAVLYGLAWHDQPTKERHSERRSNNVTQINRRILKAPRLENAHGRK